VKLLDPGREPLRADDVIAARDAESVLVKPRTPLAMGDEERLVQGDRRFDQSWHVSTRPSVDQVDVVS